MTARHRPDITPLTQPFWDAAASGRLNIQRCTNCSVVRPPTSAICDNCLSTNYEWIETSGRGSISSFIVVNKELGAGIPLPYCVAQIRLDEGVMYIANIIDCPIDQLEVDQPVAVVFEDMGDGLRLPQFTRP